MVKEEYVVEIKTDDGCDPKTKRTKEFAFEMPMSDVKFGSSDKLHKELRQLLKMFSDSSVCPTFTISYFLDVFVKHKSKMEFGMGNMVSFPIKIFT